MPKIWRGGCGFAGGIRRSKYIFRLTLLYGVSGFIFAFDVKQINRRTKLKIRKDDDGSFEVETTKGIFGFNSWMYDDTRTSIELFDNGEKVGELTGSQAIELYDALTPDSDYE